MASPVQTEEQTEVVLQRAPARDAVTGQLLSESAATARYTLPGDTSTRPTRLHVHRPSPCRGGPSAKKYWHGGPEWSPEWTRYIGGQVPIEIAAERQQWHEWWTSTYAVKVVRRSLGDQATDAILAWKLQGQHYHAVTQRLRKGHRWLATQERRATRIIRAEVFPYDSPRRKAS